MNPFKANQQSVPTSMSWAPCVQTQPGSSTSTPLDYASVGGALSLPDAEDGDLRKRIELLEKRLAQARIDLTKQDVKVIRKPMSDYDTVVTSEVKPLNPFSGDWVMEDPDVQVEDQVVQTIRRRCPQIPLNPDIKVWTQLWSTPATPDELVWIKATKTKTCHWLDMAIMAIRTTEYMRKKDFCPTMHPSLFPNVVSRLVYEDGTTMHLVDKGSSNFFRKTLEGLTRMENSLRAGTFPLQLIEWLEYDPHIAGLLLFRDEQLFTRYKQTAQEHYEINRPIMYDRLNKLRIQIGASGRDYGWGRVIGDPKAEAFYLLECFKDGATWTIERLKDYWGQVTGLLGSFGGSVGSYAKDVLTWMQTKMMNGISDIVQGLMRARDAAMASVAIKFLACVLAVCVLSMLGLITWRKAKAFLFAQSNAEEEDLLAGESHDLGDDGEVDEAETVGFLATWMGRLFDLKDKTIDQISTRAKSVSTIMGLTGLGVSAAASCLFFACYMWTDGIRAISGNLNVEEREWCERAAMVITLSKTQSVIFSKEYGEAVTQLLDSGRGLCFAETTKESKMTMMKFYSEMINLGKIIEQSKDQVSKRATPFCIGIYGPPGTGKTEMGSALTQALLPGKSMYVRTGASGDYWDGYAMEDAVLYDEFMSSPLCEHDAEFLTLISSAPFIANMASTDNINVGIKGTKLEPKLVMCTSNVQFPKVKVDRMAFERRRNVNLEVTLTEEAEENWCEEGILDLGLVPEKIRNERGYMKIRFANRIFINCAVNKTKTYTFKEAVKRIKTLYAKHMETADSLLSASGLNVSRKPASEIMEEVLTRVKTAALPRKPTIMDFLGFTGGVAQTKKATGKSKKLSKAEREEFTEGVGQTGKNARKVKDMRKAERKELMEGDCDPSGHNAYKNIFVKGEAPKPVEVIPEETQMTSKQGSTADSDVLEDYIDALSATSETESEESNPAPKKWRVTDAHGGRSYPREGTDPRKYVIEDSDSELDVDTCDLNNIDALGFDPFSDGEINIRNPWKAWTLAASVPLIAWAAWSLGKWVCGKNTHPKGETLELEAESISYGKKHVRAMKRTGLVHRPGELPETEQWSGGSAQASPINKNIGKISMDGTTTNCTFITGNVFAGPYHFFRKADGSCVPRGTSFTVMTEHNTLEIEFEPRDARWNVATDTMLYRVTSQTWKPLKDLSSRLIKEAELEDLAEFKGIFHDGDAPKYVRCYRSPVGDYKCGAHTYQITWGIVYHYKTQAGQCGSFLMAGETKYNGKIVGLHVAGSVRKDGKPLGFAVPITKESFGSAFKEEDLSGTHFSGSGEGQREDSDLATHIEQVRSHKDAILLLGMQIPGIPVPWHILRKHDDSKLQKAEAPGYVDKWVRKLDTQAWRDAWAHHQANNPHHPEYWGESPMPQVFLAESVIDGLACAWERDYGMKKMPLSVLAANRDKDGKFKDRPFDRYSGDDKERALSFLRELQHSKVILDPDFDVCRWKVDYKKNMETFTDIVRGPNVVSVEEATYNNISPGHSKLRPTIFHGKMGGKDKFVPILSQDDPRSRGYDPLVMGAVLASKNVQVDINKKNLARAKKGSLASFRRRVPNIFPRELTIDEAIQGIPGMLRPINDKTSPGYPLVRERSLDGKTDFIVRGPDQKPVPTDYLRERVAAFLDDMENLKDMESIFLAHLKDEKVTLGKITEIRTRVTYCGDLVANVAFRMKYGAALINFGNAGAKNPAVIGVNPQSYDTQDMKDYLDEIADGEFLAGDFKAFDLRYQVPVQDAAYEVLGNLLSEWLPESFREAVWKIHVAHQSKGAKIQYGRFLILFLCAHFSGVFWTTVLNIIVNDIYQRLAFIEICPKMEFEDHVRAALHGDDNRLKISRAAVKAGVTPIRWAQAMATIGQEYTSDVKDAPLTTAFKSFEESSFLGTFPKKVPEGGEKYSGALRMDSIRAAVEWKRDGESVEQTVDAMLDACSQHGVKVYTEFKNLLMSINAENPEEARVEIKDTSFNDRAITQANRTGANGFGLQSFEPKYKFTGGVAESQGETPIVQIGTTGKALVVETGKVNPRLSARSVHSTPMGVYDAMTQKVFRGATQWTVAGLTTPIKLAIPYGLLGQGEQTSMQNRVFEMYIWFKGTVVIDVQLNAQPFSQGCLVAYYRPLSVYSLSATGDASTNSAGHGFTCHHMPMMPDVTTYQMKIPFIFPRNVLNNFAASEGDGTLGTFFIEVLNNLEVVTGATVAATATVSIFSSFEDVEMYLPKPLSSVPLRNMEPKWIPEDVKYSFEDGRAQGGGQSVTNNNFAIEAGGDVPIQLDNSGQSSGPSVSTDVTADMAIPMDAPPMVGGGIPTYGQYSSMAKANGLRPTVGMSLHPKQMFRTLPDTFSMGPTSLSGLMSLTERARVLTWTTAHTVGTSLGEWGIRLGMPQSSSGGQHPTSTIHQTIGGMFQFWRSSYAMTFLAAKTQFHTGKLKVVIGYGVPPGITWDQASNYEGHVLDFDQTSSMREVKVPYNAETAWLNTYSGKRVTDPVQDFTMATVNVFVQNQLVCPESVCDSVYVNVLESFPDCELAVPKPFTFTETAWGQKPISGSSPFSYYSVVDPYLPPASLPPMVAESATSVTGDSGMPGLGIVEGGETTITNPDEGQITTATSGPGESNAPCKLTTWNHFEYAPQTVEELGRRHAQMSQGRDYMLSEAWQYRDNPDAGFEWTKNRFGKPNARQGSAYYTVLTIQVRPIHPLCGYFAAWKGSIHLRIFIGANTADQAIEPTAGGSQQKSGDGVYRACFVPLKENPQLNAVAFKPMDVVAYMIQGPIWQRMAPDQEDPSEPATWYSGNLSPETVYPAVEALFPNTENKGFIDILVPFQTIFNFLPVQEFAIGDTITSIPVAVGQVQVLLPGHCNPEVYCAFGDDLKLGAFKGMYTSKKDMKIDTGVAIYPGGGNVQTMAPP